MALNSARLVRVWLPLGQLIIAAGLTTRNLLRPEHMSSPTWVYPDKQFCDGINAPASLIRFLAVVALPRFAFPFTIAVYFTAVAFTWYLVSLEISGRSPGWTSVLTAKSGERGWADVLLILVGATLAVLGVGVRHQFAGVSTYSNLVAIPYFLWATSIVTFYGHDLWVHRSRKRKMVR